MLNEVSNWVWRGGGGVVCWAPPVLCAYVVDVKHNLLLEFLLPFLTLEFNCYLSGRHSFGAHSPAYSPLNIAPLPLTHTHQHRGNRREGGGGGGLRPCFAPTWLVSSIILLLEFLLLFLTLEFNCYLPGRHSFGAHSPVYSPLYRPPSPRHTHTSVGVM